MHVAASDSLTVEQAANSFLQHYKARWHGGTLTGHGYRNVESRIGRLLVDRFGKRKVSEISATDIEDLISEWSSRYGAWTVKGYTGTVKVFFDFAIKKRWAKVNPVKAADVELPSTKKRKAVPTKADIEAILAASNEMTRKEIALLFVNRRVAFVLGVFAGLRPGETFGLQWEDIDFKNGVLNIAHSYSIYDGLKAPKSEAGNRKIPLSPPVLEALRQVAAYRMARDWATGPGHISYSRPAISHRIRTRWESFIDRVDFSGLKGYVIETAPGEARKSVGTTKQFWWPVMKKAGLFDEEAKRPRFTMHALRHAAASLFIEVGLQPFNLSQVMGHSSVSITYNVYGHLFPEDKSISLAVNSIAGQFSTRQESNNAA